MPNESRSLTVGVGAVARADADVVLRLGPQHPSTHGGLRLALTLAGDRITNAEPEVGFLHRGAEKLFEVRDYRQVTVLANRHDWLSAFSNEVLISLAVERLLGLAVPERATWLRTLLAELNRVLAHLAFLGATPADLGAPGPLVYAATEREAVLAVMEEIAGGRMHFMLSRVGGLKHDAPAGWTDRVRRAADEVRRVLPDLERIYADDDAVRAATDGVGVLAPALAAAHGASGPVLRACGVDVDLRRDDPGLAYAEMGFGGPAFPVVTGTRGDAAARFGCLLGQLRVSLDLIDALAARLPAGPVSVRLPSVVRPAEGSTYVWAEAPQGDSGVWLVSRGEPTPWRLRLRTPSFAHAQLLGPLLTGARLADVVPVLASLFLVIGDIDK